MSTTADSSQGTKLKVKISSVYTLIPQCKMAPLPAITPAFDEISNLDSPVGFPERTQIGYEFSQIQTDIVYNKSNSTHQFLQTAALTPGSILDFEWEHPSGTPKFDFSGYITWEIKSETRKAIVVAMTVFVTGAVTAA
jgi:hypothetical protein